MRNTKDQGSVAPNVREVTKFLMQNKDKADKITATHFINLDQIIEIGSYNMNSLHNLFEYDEVYTNCIEKGWTTADELVQLIKSRDGQISFEALGKYPEAVYKLHEYGITLDKLREPRLKDGESLSTLLRNVSAAIYFIKNNNVDSLKYLYQVGYYNYKTQSILLKNLNSVILLAENNNALSSEQISNLELMNTNVMECLFKYSQIYAEYIKRRLITFDKLFRLIEDKVKLIAFEALGEYPEAVETLLEIFIPFGDMYIFGFHQPIKFKDLLQDINSPTSQVWIREHSPVVNHIYMNQKKLDIVRINILNFSSFMRRNNCNIDDILKLPLTVIERFVENDFNDMILKKPMFDEAKMLMLIHAQKVEFGSTMWM